MTALALHKRSKRDWFLFAIALVVSCNVLFFYGLPVGIVFVLTAALAWLFLYVGGANALLASLSFAFGTLMFVGLLKVTKREQGVYFRPQEILSVYDGKLGHYRYQRNARIEMEVEHGDLLAISSKSPIEPESRHVVFQTDGFGFRNKEDYHGQEFLLVGDSFIAGNGATQSALLSEVLHSEYGIDTYNLAHPGKMRDYAKYTSTFRHAYGNNFKVLLFLYEGNDFPEANEPDSPWIANHPFLGRAKSLFEAYHKTIKKTMVYRYTYSLRHKYAKKWSWNKKDKKIPTVIVRSMRGMDVGFYEKEIDVAEGEMIPSNPETERLVHEMRTSIAHIFFIPTKYRVYYKHMGRSNPDGSLKRLPHRQWEYVEQLGKSAGVPVTDLTPALILESDELLEQGKLTYYRDDTHWNDNGVRVAAEVVAKTLGQSSAAPIR